MQSITHRRCSLTLIINLYDAYTMPSDSQHPADTQWRRERPEGDSAFKGTGLASVILAISRGSDPCPAHKPLYCSRPLYVSQRLDHVNVISVVDVLYNHAKEKIYIVSAPFLSTPLPRVSVCSPPLSLSLSLLDPVPLGSSWNSVSGRWPTWSNTRPRAGYPCGRHTFTLRSFARRCSTSTRRA